MPKIHVIAAIPFSAADRARLTNLGAASLAISNPPSRTDVAEILNRVGDAELVMTTIAAPLSAEVIANSPRLKMIQTWSTGVDHIDLVAARAAGITVCNVPDFSVESVAENTLGQMIVCANRLVDAHRHAVAGGWEFTRFVGRELKGRTLLIVGYGRIGQRVGELATAFGLKIRVTRSSTPQGEFHSALSEADFVSFHCPYLPQTRHLMSDAEFAQLKPGAILINNSRGGVVDEEALLRALDSGRVAAAALDVFEQEPPRSDHPLLTHPRVFVTPHTTWNTEESRARLSESAISGLEAFMRGAPLNVVVAGGLK